MSPLPTRWVRKKDGMKAIVTHIGGGGYDWIDLKLASGRTVTISLTGLRKKYDPAEEQD